MNMFAIRESKFTFSGEHKTIYKNDSELSAHNGLAIAGSKIGISASGQFDAIAPTITNLCTEHNTVQQDLSIFSQHSTTNSVYSILLD